MNPIIGKRYHCHDKDCCDDFDLCEECFNKVKHPHILFPITKNKIK